MPQSSTPYASARISALGKGLLDRQTVLHMAESSLDDVLRTLQELRYGGLSDSSAFDIEQMIENVRIRTAEEVMELSSNPDITDLFLLQTDIQNLKLLLKARILGVHVGLQAGGLYLPEDLRRMVDEQAYGNLPVQIRSSLQNLEQRLKVEIDPQTISVALDRAYLAHALAVAAEIKDDFSLQYFGALCDFNNIITLLRLRALHAPKERLRATMLPEANVSFAELAAAFDASADSLSHAFSAANAHHAVSAALTEYQQTGSIAGVERARDNYLLSLVSAHKFELFTIYPLIGYLLARDREAKAIRLIVTVKRNGLDDALIRERLCELYG